MASQICTRKHVIFKNGVFQAFKHQFNKCLSLIFIYRETVFFLFHDKISYICLCPPKNTVPHEPRVVALCTQTATLPGLYLRMCWEIQQ